MLIDAFNIFDPEWTAVTTTAASTNIYNTGSTGDIGIGEPMYLVVNTGTAFAGGTSVTISLEADTTSSFSSPVAIFTSQAFLTAGLTANTNLLNNPIPPGCKQYLRVKYTVSGTYTAGTVTAYLSPEQYQANRSYPSGINVSSV